MSIAINICDFILDNKIKKMDGGPPVRGGFRGRGGPGGPLRGRGGFGDRGR